MARRDPYNLKETYLKWKDKALKNGIKGLTKANSDLILQYLADMEQGINVAPNNRKGARSYIRLKVICSRLPYLAREFQKRFSINILTDIDERQLCGFFSEMRNGNVKKMNGKQYKSVRDYVKNFKAFWHWHQRINRKEGRDIQDITVDLDTSGEKPDWVYLTEDQIKHLCSEARYDYEVLIWFLFDTGIRAPPLTTTTRPSPPEPAKTSPSQPEPKSKPLSRNNLDRPVGLVYNVLLPFPSFAGNPVLK